MFGLKIKSLQRVKSLVCHQVKLLPAKKVLFVIVFLYFTLFILGRLDQNHQETVDSNYEVNNFGTNVNLLVNKTRHRQVPKSELKKILFWNDAYGVRTYDVGFGQQHFYENLCPDTRCLTTSNRSYLNSVEDFDAIVIHQRGIDWADMPKKRRPQQRYIHWVIESSQYLYMDIHNLDNYFNWTMTYKKNSDFYLPYGRVFAKRQHPPAGSPELEQIIREFGQNNQHLAHNRSDNKAAWFVSHCATQARREKYVKELQKFMPVQVYGKCATSFHKKDERLTCSRQDESECYLMLENKYKFYLSFENSLCSDYVTEKFFNVLKYDVIPVTFNGADMTSIAPPHSYVHALDYKNPEELAKALKDIANDDALYASYFWWRDYYEIRNSAQDRAQAYCDLCSRLNDPQEPVKVYKDMHDWWVNDSHCKKYNFRPS